MVGLSSFLARISFSGGTCSLTLSDETTSFTVNGSLLVDCFSALARCLHDLMTERQSVSVVWGGEPGGYFVDFAAVQWNIVGIAVSKFADPIWYGSEDGWIPQRGALVWSTVGSRARLIGALTASIKTHVGPSIEGWPFMYPTEVMEQVEALGVRQD